LLSEAVILPFLVITRQLKLFVPLLFKKPNAFTLLIFSGKTVVWLFSAATMSKSAHLFSGLFIFFFRQPQHH
jgi:hypothetical protein